LVIIRPRLCLRLAWAIDSYKATAAAAAARAVNVVVRVVFRRIEYCSIKVVFITDTVLHIGQLIHGVRSISYGNFADKLADTVACTVEH
jgi:hypothetical protein